LAEGLADAHFQFAVVMGVVDLVEKSVKKILEMFQIPDRLMGQFPDEPIPDHPVVPFDLSAGGWISGLGVDPVDAQEGQALAENAGIIS
jgi:hypothetical protein